MIKLCYWCGKAATSDEHVPPKGIFPSNKRDGLITVNSCHDHNESFSKLDEKFRFYLQVATLDESVEAKDIFENKTIKIFKRNESKYFAKYLSDSSYKIEIDGNERIVFDVSVDEQLLYFEKIIRGLYFYYNKKIVPENFIITSYSFAFIKEPEIEKDVFNVLKNIYNQMWTSDLIDGNFKNPEIFRYKYFLFSDVFFSEMIFYNNLKVFGFVTPKI